MREKKLCQYLWFKTPQPIQIVVEMKAKPLITKEDYIQMQRYLQAGNYRLGLVVNFRTKYLRTARVIRSNS